VEFEQRQHAQVDDQRERNHTGDNRVLALVNAFLKTGILTEDRRLEDTTAGTPQGGILSPLLANVALSVLDEYIARHPADGAPATRSARNGVATGCRTFGSSGTRTAGA
jgi:RNA-directed DNA polymerase